MVQVATSLCQWICTVQLTQMDALRQSPFQWIRTTGMFRGCLILLMSNFLIDLKVCNTICMFQNKGHVLETDTQTCHPAFLQKYPKPKSCVII